MTIPVSQIIAGIQEELGNHPELPDGVMRRMLDVANGIILSAEDWEQEPTEVVITIPAEVTGTDAGVTLDSATVTTADAVAAWVNRFFRRGSDEFFYEITAQSAGVSITIEEAWPLATATAQSFTIFPRLLTPASDARSILEVWGERRLEKRSLTWLNDHDADRSDTTDDVPQVWVPAQRSSQNVPRIEVWPRPTTATPLRIVYERSGALSGDGVSPIYPAHLLSLRGMVSALTRLAARTSEKQIWASMAAAKRTEYAAELKDAIYENRTRTQAKTKTTGSGVGVVTDFALDHDVWGV